MLWRPVFFCIRIDLHFYKNVAGMKGDFRDLFGFILAVFLCGFGVLIYSIIFQKSASSISSEQANSQRDCCGAKMPL